MGSSLAHRIIYSRLAAKSTVLTVKWGLQVLAQRNKKWHATHIHAHEHVWYVWYVCIKCIRSMYVITSVVHLIIADALTQLTCYQIPLYGLATLRRAGYRARQVKIAPTCASIVQTVAFALWLLLSRSIGSGVGSVEMAISSRMLA